MMTKFNGCKFDLKPLTSIHDNDTLQTNQNQDVLYLWSQINWLIKPTYIVIDGKLQIFFVFLRQLRLSHDHIRDCPHHVTSQISWFLHLAIHIILTYQNKETLNFFEESIELHPTGEYRITAYIQNIQIVLRLIIDDPPFSLMTKVRGPSSMITVLPVLIWENTKAASINMTLSFPLSRYCSSMENLILSPVFSFNSWSRPTSWKKLLQKKKFNGLQFPKKCLILNSKQNFIFYFHLFWSSLS